MTQPANRPQTETIQTIAIEKLTGLNLSSPRSSFGQPIVLQNVYLDRRGGYVTAPGMRLITALNFNIVSVKALSGIDIALAIHPAVFTNEGTRVPFTIVNINTGATLLNYNQGLGLVATYKTGFAAYYAPFAPTTSITLFTVDRSNNTVMSTPISTDFDLVITIEYLGLYATAPVAGAPYSYPKDSLTGFNPRHTNYILIYVQPYLTNAVIVEGTTLNPTPPKPHNIKPYIVRIRPNPGGVTEEYKVKITNLGGAVFYAFAETAPTRRPILEWYGPSGVAIARNTAVSLNTLTTYSVTIDDKAVPLVYQCTGAGTSGAGPVDTKTLPTGYGSVFYDGSAAFTCVGNRDELLELNFAEWAASVQDGPLSYVDPAVRIPEIPMRYGKFAQCYTTPDGYIYRSRAAVRDDFTPTCFFPCGDINEPHQGRTWVVPDTVWRYYAYEGSVTADIQRVGGNFWESTQLRQTVYYSEPDVPWDFQERFIVLPLAKSTKIVAVQSIGNYLIFLGDADGVVLSGESEANFYAKSIDIPGAYYQDLTTVMNGVLYYRGIGGIYRLNGGTAERISDEVAPLIPDAVGARESISRDDTHIHFQLDNFLVLTYDTISNAWSTQDTFHSFDAPGEISLAHFNQNLCSMTGPSDRLMRVTYADVDMGDRLHRMTVRSLSMFVEGFYGSIDATVLAHTQNSDGVTSPSRPRLVSQMNNFLQWRFKNIQGHSFDLTIEVTPQSAPVTIKPGVSIEVYRGEVMRRGY